MSLSSACCTLFFAFNSASSLSDTAFSSLLLHRSSSEVKADISCPVIFVIIKTLLFSAFSLQVEASSLTLVDLQFCQLLILLYNLIVTRQKLVISESY
jgi:integral membrane sensor domain MASE1